MSKRHLTLSSLAAVAFASPVGARPLDPARTADDNADGLERRGFAASLGLGAAATTLSVGGADTAADPTAAGFDLSVGGFVSRDVALLGRVSASSFDNQGARSLHGSVQAAVQLWVNDRFGVEGGVGVGVLAPTEGYRMEQSDLGLSVSNRLTYRATRGLQASFDVKPSFHPDATAVSTTLLVGYQWD